MIFWIVGGILLYEGDYGSGGLAIGAGLLIFIGMAIYYHKVKKKNILDCNCSPSDCHGISPDCSSCN
jgi:hypothetical protein